MGSGGTIISFRHRRTERVKTLEVLKPRGRECLSPIVLSSTELLSCCIHSMIKHNWYRVVPINHWKCDDIAFSIGQSWDLLRLLMIELGYIKFMMRVDCVRVKQLRLLCDNFNGDTLILSDTHLKGEKNTISCVLGSHYLLHRVNK